MKAQRRKECGITKTGRRCSQCSEIKPWDEFYKRKTGVEGRGTTCKVCIRAAAAKRYENDLDYQHRVRTQKREAYQQRHQKLPPKKRRGFRGDKLVWNDQGRYCTRCKKFKEWESFALSKHGVCGRQNTCRTCAQEVNLEWLNKPGNRQKKKLWQKKYYQNRKKHLHLDDQAAE